MKDDEIVKAIVTDPELQQRFAKYVALRCFRNSTLENLHSGKVPASKTGDYSDVVVHTPFGQIPWREISRFNDAEMKDLMIDVNNKVFHLMQDLVDEKKGGELIANLVLKDPAPFWNDPK